MFPHTALTLYYVAAPALLTHAARPLAILRVAVRAHRRTDPPTNRHTEEVKP
jgi:hypothetical protein